MKMGPDALVTVENNSGHRKHAKQDPTPSVPPKMSLGAHNMKIRPDALGTIENESRSAKHENCNRRPQYRRKHVRERKIEKGPDALDTAEKESGSAKHEKYTQRPRYRRKWFPTPSKP
jgi:hypothetical protein